MNAHQEPYPSPRVTVAYGRNGRYLVTFGFDDDGAMHFRYEHDDHRQEPSPARRAHLAAWRPVEALEPDDPPERAGILEGVRAILEGYANADE